MSSNDFNTFKKEAAIIEIAEIDDLNALLSRIIIPLGEVLHREESSDIYRGYEQIPFTLRDPCYKDIMLQEFERDMLEFEIQLVKELIL